jgi:hypothetical protein
MKFKVAYLKKRLPAAASYSKNNKIFLYPTQPLKEIRAVCRSER